jgi:hypothetical protein
LRGIKQDLEKPYSAKQVPGHAAEAGMEKLVNPAFPLFATLPDREGT